MAEPAEVVQRDFQKARLCCQCGLDILPEAEYVINKRATETRAEVVECRNCNRLKKRIHSIRSGCETFSAWSDLDPEERKLFMRRSADLFGNELAKEMKETMRTSNTKTLTTTATETGTPMTLAEASDLPRYRANPEAFETLKNNAQKYVCPVDGLEYIVVPTRRFEKVVGNVDQLERSREVRQLSTIKRKGAPKEKAGVASEPALPEGHKQLTAGQHKQLAATLAKVNDGISPFALSIRMASAEVSKEYIASKSVERASATMDDLKSAAAELEGIQRAGHEKPENVAEAIKSAKDITQFAYDTVLAFNGALSLLPDDTFEQLRNDAYLQLQGEDGCSGPAEPAQKRARRRRGKCVP